MIIAVTSASARASMWVDPDWEQMLKESELIALVEVIEGGKYVAKVRPLTLFRGEMGSEFYVTEFNNHNWPADAIETESFRGKQRYYLFLRQRENAVHYLEFLGEAEKTGLVRFVSDLVTAVTGWRFGSGRYEAPLKAAKSGRLWSVWSPTAGDLPVVADEVRYSWLHTSYPRQAPARDRTDFERSLKAAAAFHGHGQLEPGLLDEALQGVRTATTRMAPASDGASELSHLVARYYLLGGRAYDVVFERIATGDDAEARRALARLLGFIGEKKAGELLLVMLRDKDSLVQGEVVRQLAKGEPKQVGPILLAHLASARAGGTGPQGLMDPVRNQLDGGKVEIIRALGELKYQPAAPALIESLESVDGAYQLRVLLEALEKMENRDYPRALEGLLRDPKLVREIAEWVRDHDLKELKSVFENLVENPPAGAVGGAHWVAIEALGKIGDEGSGARLTAFLQNLSAREIPGFFDSGVTAAVIGALAELRYKPARDAVEQAFFYWLGIDSTFETKPQLLELKRRLEAEIEREAVTHFRDFAFVDAQALVFLNRRAMADGAATKPEFSFALEVNIRSPEHPELDAETLKPRLEKAFPQQPGTVSVTRWDGNFGKGSEGNDVRLNALGSDFFWRYGQYVQKTRDPQDLRFVKFLLDSGLAQKWGAKDYLAEAIGSTSEP